MKDRLIKLLEKTFAKQYEKRGLLTTPHTADYLLANSVIVPPINFLEYCYVLPTIENNLPEITKMKCIGFSLSHDSYNVNLITDKNKLYQPCFGSFGKVVFLTREEAERTLEGRKEE